MGRTSTATDAGLVRSSAAEQADAWRHREVLLAAAATLVTAAGHDPDRARCDDASCKLDDGRVCDVAHRLARLPDAPAVTAVEPLATASARFETAVTACADAIRHCRQTVHVGRRCWFSADARSDGCGEVLHLLHHLS